MPKSPFVLALSLASCLSVSFLAGTPWAAACLVVTDLMVVPTAIGLGFAGVAVPCLLGAARRIKAFVATRAFIFMVAATLIATPSLIALALTPAAYAGIVVTWVAVRSLVLLAWYRV